MKYLNVDEMLKDFTDKTKLIKSVRKYSGISIGCSYDKRANKDNVIKEIKKICKSMKLPSNSVSTSVLDEYELILEFPDFIPEYIEEQQVAMYESNVIWLLDNAFKNDLQHKLTKDILVNGAKVYAKHIGTMYYRSNINKYKISFEEFYTAELEARLCEIYLKVLDEYLKKKGGATIND